MKLAEMVSWLDESLNVRAFDDVSNNGLQIDRDGCEIQTVAFAVDASVRAVEAAVAAGAELLVVHHGISWGGGIRRIAGGVGRVVRAAIRGNLALYACHLPLDAHPQLGNNANLARSLKLKNLKPAFSYHGNVIGIVGEATREQTFETCKGGLLVPKGARIGVCSGGAGEFAEEAKNLGCDVFLTGEANWGDVIAAENCEMPMVCGGHYETEVHGVRAVAQKVRRELKVRAMDLTEDLK